MNTQTQPSLFSPGGYVAPSVSPTRAELQKQADERIAKMKAAEDAEKNRACVLAFEPFLIEFNENNSNYIIADVVAEYEAAGNPRPARDYRAIGGVINRLVGNGTLVPTGDARKLTDGTGRMMAIYRGK